VKILAIIPSRYGSTRFPGKPLVIIEGKTMIQRVYERSSLAFRHVCVATDDQRIFDEVVRFGGDVVMTSSAHRSGTDRCFEAMKIVETRDLVQYDIVVNVQGDEPFISPDELLELVNCFNDNWIEQWEKNGWKTCRECDVRFYPGRLRCFACHNNYRIGT